MDTSNACTQGGMCLKRENGLLFQLHRTSLVPIDLSLFKKIKSIKAFIVFKETVVLRQWGE